MKIHVRYFASVREQLGAGEWVMLVPADTASDTGTGSNDASVMPGTVGALRTWLIARSEAHAAALDLARGLRTAYNQTLCGPDQPLADGAEVAFFPPVTGG